MANMPSQTVHLLVFDAMSDWEADFIVAAIHKSQPRSTGRPYSVVTAAAAPGHVTTIGGRRIRPDITLPAVTPEASALLVLPGGHAWDLGANAEALELASRFIAHGTPVVALCAATQALARTGLLDHLRLTGTAREYLISSGHRGAGFYCGVPAAAEQGAISIPGAGPIDFAREIFKVLHLASPAPGEAWRNPFVSGGGSKYQPLSTN